MSNNTRGVLAAPSMIETHKLFLTSGSDYDQPSILILDETKVVLDLRKKLFEIQSGGYLK